MISKIYSWLWRELFTISLETAAAELYRYAIYERNRIRLLPWEQRWKARSDLVEMLKLADDDKMDDHFWNCLGQIIVMNAPYLARNVKTRRYEDLEEFHGWYCHSILIGGAKEVFHLGYPRRVTHDNIRIRRKDLNILLESFGA